MNPKEQLEPSPFAAFAMPKRSAVEEFQEKQRKAAAAWRTLIGCVLAALVGAMGGSTACAAFDADLDAALTAFVGSLLGGVLGVVVGSVIGAMCFAVLGATNLRARNIGQEFARRDPMAAIRGMIFVWSLVGAALGSAQGALYGARWAGAVQPSLARWIVASSVVGGAFGLAVWFFTSRRRRASS